MTRKEWAALQRQALEQRRRGGAAPDTEISIRACVHGPAAAPTWPGKVAPYGGNRPRTTRKASGSRDPFYESSRWRRESREFLARSPTCAHCPASAVIVDHISPRRERPDLEWSRANWQGLCRSCDSRKRRVEQGERGVLPRAKPRPIIGPDGCPVANHFWSDE
jgi:hypothetical protein